MHLWIFTVGCLGRFREQLGERSHFKSSRERWRPTSCTQLVCTPRVERASGCHTATVVAGGSATVDRVPSWPQGGRAGTDGPDFRIPDLAEMDTTWIHPPLGYHERPELLIGAVLDGCNGGASSAWSHVYLTRSRAPSPPMACSWLAKKVRIMHSFR
jgi:hypothetical protein